MKYSVVLIARNEEECIGTALSALRKQSVPSGEIVVVDDGSRDRTRFIASEYADVVVRLSDRGYGVVGRPELARVVNAGLRRVKDDVDYVLICGADDILVEDYVETIVSRMESNPRLVVASGRVEGEPFVESHPRGGGRIVDGRFWREVNGLRYPVVWGWESWLGFKALQLGYEIRCFPDVELGLYRYTRRDPEKMRLWGMAMYALGYDWKYALGRCVLTFLKSPKAGVSMFLGWFLHRGVIRLDIADWVNQMQNSRLWERVQRIMHT